MLKHFNQIDLFGKGVLLNYKGNSKSKSKVGAIFTICLFGFIIWLSVYFGQHLFDTTNPQATSFESFNDNPAATPFTIDNFAMGIGMSNPYTYANYINESIYTISVTTYKTTRIPQADGSVNIIYDMVPLEMEACRPDHFGELSEKFSYSGLDGLYCFKKEQPNLNNGQPILEGNWESPVFQGIFIDLIECDRNATGNICGTQEEIDYLLGQGLLTLTFSNVAVDLTDSKKPLKKFRDGWYTSVGNDYNKEINLYLDQVEINTDDGWLTSSFQANDYIKFGEIREMFTLAKKSSYVHFVIRLSNVMKHFNRSYTKIQDIIAQVNGTVMAVFSILFILIAPYVRLKFYETLINDIFDIKSFNKHPKSPNNAAKKAAEIKKNSKGKAKKNKSKQALDKEALSSNDDLEMQKAPKGSSKQNGLEGKDLDDTNLLKRAAILDDSTHIKPKNGFLEVKDLDDSNLLKRAAILDDSTHIKHNFSEVMQRPSPIIKGVKYLKDEGENESKQISFSGMSGMALNLSGFHPGHGHGLDIESPPMSPMDSRIERANKPNFLKPNLKILEYEDHGQELFEDIFKTLDLDNREAKNNEAEDKKKADLNPEDHKMTKQQKHILSQMLRSNDDLDHQDDKDDTDQQNEERYKSQPKSVSLQRLDLITNRNTSEINLSFWEYLRSFFTRSKVIKEKIRYLNEGISRINERLDIFNIFKKLREMDKLKVLLLENEQFVLFHSLPRPELALTDDESADPHAPHNIKDPQFIQDKLKKELILLSYERLKRKKVLSNLDKKLMGIYDDFLIPKS